MDTTNIVNFIVMSTNLINEDKKVLQKYILVLATFPFLLNLSGRHWLIKLYRTQVYNFI